MKEIEELVKNTKKYKKAIIQKNLKSKKNTVAYITQKGKPRIIKWFVPGLKQQMKIEYNILKKGSSKLNIPTVYEMDEKNNVLLMNYLIGENLCDLINDENSSTSEKERLMILLADWFNDFHNFFKKEKQFVIRGDPSLRNFIFTDKLWGVDFEESRNGRPVEDLAGLCASVLTTDPMFTPEKFKLCRHFLEHYNKLAPGRIINASDEISYALLEKIQWRPEDEDILRKYSKRIRENGLNS
jgi:tRNA A-37 threonylcarbamoyl transferase component Bud32